MAAELEADLEAAEKAEEGQEAALEVRVTVGSTWNMDMSMDMCMSMYTHHVCMCMPQVAGQLEGAAEVLESRADDAIKEEKELAQVHACIWSSMVVK